MALPNKYAEVTPRNFNPMWAPGLSDEARKAVNAAFDAMSTWRIETANNNEKNSEQVIEKMAAAARALGWPDQIVDATRAQMQTVSQMQVQVVDNMIDAWEKGIKSPGSSSAMLSKLKILPNLGPTGSWPSATFDPFGTYAQITQQWQKAWADATAFWINVGKTNGWKIGGTT